jgi:hypothetical protein
MRQGMRKAAPYGVGLACQQDEGRQPRHSSRTLTGPDAVPDRPFRIRSTTRSRRPSRSSSVLDQSLAFCIRLGSAWWVSGGVVSFYFLCGIAPGG